MIILEAISKLEYTMIADPSKEIARSFEVLDEEAGMAQRGTFIIDGRSYTSL